MVENMIEISTFEGYGVPITLSPEEYPYQTAFAFFYGKFGKNLIVCRNNGNLIKYAERTDLPTKNIEYFAKRRIEDYVNIDVVDIIKKRDYSILREEKDKLIDGIKNSSIFIFYSPDYILQVTSSDPTITKKINLDEILNQAKSPEKVKNFLDI